MSYLCDYHYKAGKENYCPECNWEEQYFRRDEEDKVNEDVNNRTARRSA